MPTNSNNAASTMLTGDDNAAPIDNDNAAQLLVIMHMNITSHDFKHDSDDATQLLVIMHMNITSHI